MTKAKIRTPYLLRLLMIAVFCIGIALWFLKDGLISYPRQQAWALAFEQSEKEGRPLAEWKEIARATGWDPDRVPEEAKTDGDIFEQKLIAAMAVVPGLLYLFFLAQNRGRWIETTDTGLRTSSGQAFDFGDIKTLDKKKWKDKGIAKITYQSQSGEKRLTLDDWKYETEPIVAILIEVESHLDEEQIVGGFPEPPPGEVEEEVEEGDHEEAEEQDDSDDETAK